MIIWLNDLFIHRKNQPEYKPAKLYKKINKNQLSLPTAV